MSRNAWPPTGPVVLRSNVCPARTDPPGLSVRGVPETSVTVPRPTNRAPEGEGAHQVELPPAPAMTELANAYSRFGAAPNTTASPPGVLWKRQNPNWL